MAKRSKMTESELASLLDGQIADAVSYEESELAKNRDWALKYYEADPDQLNVAGHLPYQEGKSRVVSHDVADIHGWVMPGLMRVFCSGDRVADYQPVGIEDVQFSKDATDGVNFLFLERCDGYYQLRTGTSDGLLLGNGILKHWWDHTTCDKVSTHYSLNDLQFTELVKDVEKEDILAHTERPVESTQEAAAAGGALTVHDLKIRRKEKRGLRCEALPPENFLIPRNAKKLDETIEGCGDWSLTTRSDLIKRGIDREIVDSLPAYAAGLDNATQGARDNLNSGTSDGNPDKSMERVRVHEWYPLVDYNGDGVAERLMVLIGDRSDEKGERKILLMEEWEDDIPYTDIVPDPVPHRWRGRSLYDEAADMQRLKSAVWRQIMNNTYLQNEQQKVAVDGQVVNPDELISPSLGGIVWVKSQGAVEPLVTPNIAGESFQALEYADAVLEKRTGVSRATMALDPDTLQNQTATAVNAAQSAAQSKVELYARNIAETGLKRLFKCLLRLVIKHQDGAFWIRRQGKPIQVDPRYWNADMDVSVNVGLGAGNRDQDMMLLQAVAQKQEFLIGTFGPDNPVCGLDKLRETYSKMIEIGGLRSPELYFNETPPEAIQQWMQAKSQQPDPKMLELQMKQQAEERKAQTEDQRQQRQAQIEQIQAEADIATTREKVMADIAREDRKAATQERLMLLEHQLKEQAAEREEARREREHQANLHFKTRDQEVSHHFAAKNHELKAQASQAKGADQ